MGAHVIVGASMAGATAAITLREASSDPITVIGMEPDPPYERPPLSKAYLRGEVTFESALVRPAAFYAEHGITAMFDTRAVRVEPAHRRVELENGRRVPYDRLLIATGGRNRSLSLPGADLPGIYGLRTVRDANRIREAIGTGRRAVVVGMGFIGSEVAASLRKTGLDVVAIDPGKTPLFRAFGEAVGRTLAHLHETHGVRMMFQDTVAAFEGDTHVVRVITRNGRRIECDFVVAGIGIEPEVEWLDGSGVAIDNGVVVDQYQRTNIDGIFAAGDVANHFHPVFGRHIRLEHWQNAVRQGAAAAQNMVGRRTAYDEIPWFWSDQYDSNVQYVGFHSTWDQLVVRGSLDSASYLACYLNDGRIDAAVGLNRGKDVRRVMPLIRSRNIVDVDRLQDEHVDLRSLQDAAAGHAPAQETS
jgi:3-phenylpropionate/trans-cinnamate dioxygenase ferredoxin reductase component